MKTSEELKEKAKEHLWEGTKDTIEAIIEGAMAIESICVGDGC